MYAIYGNIYHQYSPNVNIYIPYMDPMGNVHPVDSRIMDGIQVMQVMRGHHRNALESVHRKDLGGQNLKETAGLT